MNTHTDPIGKLDIPLQTDDEFLDSYINKPKFSSIFWKRVFLAVATIAAILYFKFGVIDESIKPEELLKMVQITSVSSQWSVKDEMETSTGKKVVLVPEITFTLRNIGPKKLKYLYFLCVFRYVDNGKTFGEGSQMTTKKGLKSGMESPPITIPSRGGYHASSIDAFLRNREEWKTVFVDLFIRTKNSGLVPIKQHYISQKIAGREIDVSLK